ncbi:MAG: hypothetical protein IJU07_04040 [Synergistaceae bacterium]|nr:hypothetical protein [Synergistaceae bacterium]
MAGIKRLPNETEHEYWERVANIVDSLDCIHKQNGQVIARYPSKYRVVPYAVEELTGILKGDYDDARDVREEALREKYAIAN